MQKLLVAVLTVAVCVGASTAQVTCSEQCLDLVQQAINEHDVFKFVPLYNEMVIAGCGDCYSYYYTSTTAAPAEDETAAEEGGSARSNARSHSRKAAGHLSRLAAAHHRSNHH